MLILLLFYFPRSILAISSWIPSERTLIMWCSYAKAKRSLPITWEISWATWLRVRVAFSLTLTKKRIIFYSTNLITHLITGSRRSYGRFFGQYQAFIRQKGHFISCLYFIENLHTLTCVAKNASLEITGAWNRLKIFQPIFKGESAKQNRPNYFRYLQM